MAVIKSGLQQSNLTCTMVSLVCEEQKMASQTKKDATAAEQQMKYDAR
jgi:hypothetical protein